jgi:hypothetical protein
MENQIEGDGLINNFFQLIWEKQEKDKGLRGFHLPDTIIYKYQQPRAWFFTSKEGYIKKRRKESLNTKTIEQKFLSKVSKSGIVCFFLHTSDSLRKIEYFRESDLPTFLHHRPKPAEGILQRFIDPLGSRNSSIQMIWTPHLCLFEKRENQNDLFNPSLDIYEKVGTFEGEDHQSLIQPFNSIEIRKFMHEVGEALAEHIAFITAERLKPTRMVLLFKQGVNGDLWFLFATSVRCASGKIIDIGTKSALPELVSYKRNAAKSRSPLCIQKKILCKNCEIPCEADRLCEIRIAQVLAAPGFPNILKKTFPGIRSEDLKDVKQQFEILSKIVMVCDNCFLGFVCDRKKETCRAKTQRSESLYRFPKSKPFQKSNISPLPQKHLKSSPSHATREKSQESKLQTTPNYPSVPALKFHRLKRS